MLKYFSNRSIHGSREISVMLVVVIGFLIMGAASAGACPNEALRSELRSGQLPDCRAYERVSPGYVESSVLTSEFAVSPEGTRVVAGSLGTYANAEHVGTINITGHVFGAAYLFSRTAAGWSAASLGPPVSENGGVGNMVDASTALDASLWELNATTSLGEVRQLYLERPRGAFTKVGATVFGAGAAGVLDYHYLGASEDLSRVLFSVLPQARWPFDGTVIGGGTLYEYTGVEQPGEARVPALVGVEGGRGSTALISHCGTRLGSSSLEEGVREEEGLATVHGSVYNAISASGARVFFTAVGSEEAGGGCEGPRVGELFAREELPAQSGEQPPANMRTVAISEPSAEDCRACLTAEPTRAPAVFQGASMDGSEVFFTTEQELLPGAAGNNLYEYDFNAPAGERVTLLSTGVADPAVQGVARISEDGTHVYFVARGRLTDEPRTGCLSGLNSAELEEEEETSEGGCRPKSEADNLYVYAEGHVSFVATLAPEDAADWARVDSRPVQLSSEGRFLVFTSVADLTHEGVSPGKRQVYQYDAAVGILARASIGQYGFGDDNREPAVGATIAARFPSSYSYAEADSPTLASSVQAPADGAVFFESPDALTPQALSDQLDFLRQTVPNIYEYRDGRVYLLSDGRDVSSVEASPATSLVGANPSGSDVFFLTADPLIPADTNTQQDLYDARAEGGFPTSTSAAGCAEGETCQEAQVAPPALALLGGSATQTAEVEVPTVESPPVLVTSKPKAVKPKKRPKPKKRHRAKARRSTSRIELRGKREKRAR
jgi:hypothetical protein